jgi:tRNA-dihydrouridine synthase A
MLTADAILRGDKERLLSFSDIEHPVALQLGGADPAKLTEASRIGEDFGYDEINLNVGCPSDRVQSGRFGACLMEEPSLVGDCVSAMRDAVKIPISVKCRIGVDEQDPEIALPVLVQACIDAGITRFVIHARKALLAQLSPKQNRDVPPLNYPLVYALKKANPDLSIMLNGGIATLDEAEHHLRHVDGVMLGRAAYQSPAILAEVDERFFSGERREIDYAVELYCDYVSERLMEGVPLNAMTKHMLGLFHGIPGSRGFRRHLSENATMEGAGLSVLRDALDFLKASDPAQAA